MSPGTESGELLFKEVVHSAPYQTNPQKDGNPDRAVNTSQIYLKFPN